MLRFIPLLLLLVAGCQRPVAVVITYAPAPVAEEGSGPRVDMARVLAVVHRRLRHERLPCRTSLDESQQIRVDVYEDRQEVLDRIDDLVLAMGTFELRIAANAEDHPNLVEEAKGTDEREIRGENGKLLGWWVPINEKSKKQMLEIPGLTTREEEGRNSVLTELLVVNDPYRVDGTLLERAEPGIDQSGRPNIAFVLTDKGGEMMAGLTTENLPDPVSRRTRKLAIIFNHRVFSTPAIQSTIRQHGEITGDFTEQYVKDLANVLTSGSLPVPLTRVSIERVGSP